MSGPSSKAIRVSARARVAITRLIEERGLTSLRVEAETGPPPLPLIDICGTNVAALAVAYRQRAFRVEPIAGTFGRVDIMCA